MQIRTNSFWIYVIFWINSPPQENSLYFQNKESPCISYSFTHSVAIATKDQSPKSMHQIEFHNLYQDPYLLSVQAYAPCDHVVTGNLNIIIVQSEKLIDLSRKGSKYREPISFWWHQKFCFIMEACEGYTGRWSKKEDNSYCVCILFLMMTYNTSFWRDIKRDFYLDVYTFLVGFNQQYGPYAHFGHWTFVSDPRPNSSLKSWKV